MIAQLLFPSLVDATDCELTQARLESIHGEAQIKRGPSASWQNVALGTVLCPADSIRVGENSRALLVMKSEKGDRTTIRLDSFSTLTIGSHQQNQSADVTLESGVAHFLSRLSRSFLIATPFVNAGIEGTEFVVAVSPDRTRVTVLEGLVRASNQAGSVLVRPGQAALALRGNQPVLEAIVEPFAAVEWAIHFPLESVTSLKLDAEALGDPKHRQALSKSVDAYKNGDAPTALQELKILSDQEKDLPNILFYRSLLHLGTGDSAEATRLLQRLQEKSPSSSLYARSLALQSLHEVLSNNPESGLKLAEEAFQREPNNLANVLALSYAQQALFRLEEALATVASAQDAGLVDVHLLIRRAELLLGKGDTSEAHAFAVQATELAPRHDKAWSIRGFTELAMQERDEARNSFQTAHELDAGSPLTRLGKALLNIREGRLSEGRDLLEQAVSLDPLRSLPRSYLGKAYYEEHQEKEAREQYNLAKELDPHDPTPWFYEAMLDITENKPVEAVRALETSRDLNDNRIPYRSRLLLDEDRAGRSAALGRAYELLNFERLAFLEGTRGLLAAPDEYASHRLLADSYSVLPRHDVARVSELLVSQLLQPLNLRPLQPQLSESSLGILRGVSSTATSFNEFFPLFERDNVAVQVNGLFGSNNTSGDDVLLSAIEGPVSFSFGQFHYETDGFRQNQDQKNNLYNVFAQTELSHTTSLQFEYRYKESNEGDLIQRFDPDNYARTRDIEEEGHTYRVGLKSDLTPHLTLLGSGIGRTQEGTFSETLDPFGLSQVRTDEESLMGEMRLDGRWSQLTFTTGGGFTTKELAQANQIADFALPAEDFTTDHSNGYIYTTVHPLAEISVIGGLSADKFEDPLGSGLTLERDSLSPKVGVLIEPIKGTTFRSAWFQALKRTLISDQTLEPTQVAGFNQFYDDPNGTKARRYGVGVDQELTRELRFGTEWSKRELNLAYLEIVDLEGNAAVQSADWNEDLIQSYLYWAPHPQFTSSLVHTYEDFDRRDGTSSFQGLESFVDVNTHTTTLRLQTQHPTGLIFFIEGVGVQQSGAFQNINTAEVHSDGNFFFLGNTGIGYRLPQRRGLMSLELRNMFDKDFQFQETDISSPRFAQDRALFGRIRLFF